MMEFEGRRESCEPSNWTGLWAGGGGVGTEPYFQRGRRRQSRLADGLEWARTQGTIFEGPSQLPVP